MQQHFIHKIKNRIKILLEKQKQIINERNALHPSIDNNKMFRFSAASQTQ